MRPTAQFTLPPTRPYTHTPSLRTPPRSTRHRHPTPTLHSHIALTTMPSSRRTVKSPADVEQPREYSSGEWSPSLLKLGHSSIIKPKRRAMSLAAFATTLILLGTPLTGWLTLSPLSARAPQHTSVDRIAARMGMLLDPASNHSRARGSARTVAAIPYHSIPRRPSPPNCLPLIVYDKPVKTASTAISLAIRQYLEDSGAADEKCGARGDGTCMEVATGICEGVRPANVSIVGHLKFDKKRVVDCLRERGYYSVTSVRDPYERRKSAYLWNRTLNASHFNIPHTAPFGEFMNRMPRCQLHHYYDGRGPNCNIEGVSVEQREREILSRHDEVIDLYDEPIGELHRRISKYVSRENESIQVSEKEYVEEFNPETLREETSLYNKLRAKRMQKPNPERVLC